MYRRRRYVLVVVVIVVVVVVVVVTDSMPTVSFSNALKQTKNGTDISRVRYTF